VPGSVQLQPTELDAHIVARCKVNGAHMPDDTGRPLSPSQAHALSNVHPCACPVKQTE
jgi:hypothetical protein